MAAVLQDDSNETTLVTVIMSCYNEANTLPAILAKVRAVDIEKEIIAVDDCSSDSTFAILQAEAARTPAMRVIRHERNHGKGAAFVTVSYESSLPDIGSLYT
jgi:glycosyltransferase involved in cell wall biosynthesis